MHSLVCGFILAIMALFPGSSGEGGLNLRAWMEAYEKHLYQQMYDNFEREKAETVTFEPKNAVSQQNIEVKVEQATVEEVQEEPSDAGAANVDDPDQSIDGGNERVAESVAEDPGPGLPETGTPVAAETAAAAEVPAPVEQVKIYAVNGAVLAEDLQAYLYRRFCEAGIGWFYEYSLLIAYQESRFNVLAENPNGRDKGLFQYRVEYYPGLDWRNPYAEADVFIQQMANRAYSGKTVAEMISAHNQSDWGPYCQSYVDAVMQHSNTLVQIR